MTTQSVKLRDIRILCQAWGVLSRQEATGVDLLRETIDDLRAQYIKQVGGGGVSRYLADILGGHGSVRAAQCEVYRDGERLQCNDPQMNLYQFLIRVSAANPANIPTQVSFTNGRHTVLYL